MINIAINSCQAYGHLWPTQCQEIQALHLTGVHLGPAGSKMMRNVLAQNRSLIEIKLAPWWHQGSCPLMIPTCVWKWALER